MKNMVKLIIFLTLIISQPYQVDAKETFLVDCKELDEIALISEKSKRFNRIGGIHYLEVQVLSLDEYGLKGIEVPNFDFDKIIKLSPPLSGIKFLPGHEDENSGDEVGVTIAVKESSYKTRDHLKSILDPSLFQQYVDTNLFEILLESLGVYDDDFKCDNLDIAVSRFVSSVIWPLGGNEVTYVYYIQNFNALMLAPDRGSFGRKEIETIRLILPNGPDDLMHIFITANYSVIESLLDSLKEKK